MSVRSRLRRAACFIMAAALLAFGAACGRKAKPEPRQGSMRAASIDFATR